MLTEIPFNVLVKEHWKIGTSSDGAEDRLLCLVCRDGVWRKHNNCRRHEQSDKHKALIEFYETNPEGNGTPVLADAHPSDSNEVTRPVEHSSVPSVLLGPIGYAFYQSQTNCGIEKDTSHAYDSTMAESGEDISWFDDATADEFEPESIQAGLDYRMDDTRSIEEWLDESIDIDSYSEDEEMPLVPDLDYAIDVSLLRSLQTRPSRVGNEASSWFPWPDKAYCVLDILRNLPRSIFSDKQNDIIHWGMSVLGIPEVPSDNSVKTVTQSLQYACGISTIRYEGALGHVYYANDLLALIAQEMSNPLIRPYLHFFPEDTGKILSNAYEARRWFEEMDEELLTPVIKQGMQNYYIFEPVILGDRTCCIPVRWFLRAGQMFAKAWRMRRLRLLGSEGWIAEEYDCLEFPTSQLTVSFPYFLQSFSYRRLPDPSYIMGSLRSAISNLRPWTYTKGHRGNRWREISKGKPVYAFPIWLYCDDTSGNKTKKWNKHNSFLFVPAGLPHNLVHREYNVHFISTSNLAEPLEMLEGIVGQIELGQKYGVWAWDCVAEEVVVLIPSVLALLGDNPMQSEFASHIGMNGKFFCRACLVHNPSAVEDEDIDDENDSTPVTHNAESGPDTGDSSQDSENPSEMEDSAELDNAGNKQRGAGKAKARRNGKSAATGKRKRGAAPKRVRSGGARGKKTETLGQLVERAREFLKIGKLRSKGATVKLLKSIYKSTTMVGGVAESKRLKTAFGLKDKYQEFFVEQIVHFNRSIKNQKGPSKQCMLDRFVETLPMSPMNPVWRIKGLDANSDTPVEVLHVILLGFLKYYWRDAVARMKPTAKAKLIVRISSLDTSGLGLPPLSGKTLVQYSGSLTGRDFRAISQVAPFVLYDLLPNECYEAWLALSALVPLVWMPVIDDLDAYLIKLTNAIDCFLNLTARFTPRWFNKPKFHVLLHLPDHIRRFGPAILFATETFESYNALIRDHSVHSNRQAPSRDIGIGFANANRIRHLTSGGKFRMGEIPTKKSLADGKGDGGIAETHKHDNKLGPDDFRTVGPDVLKFIRTDGQFKKYVGIPDSVSENNIGGVKRDKSGSRTWAETQSSRKFSSAAAKQAKLDSQSFQGFTSCALLNGDTCSLDSWVIARYDKSTSIGRVTEILQISGSPSEFTKNPDFLLLALYESGPLAETYRLPILLNTGHYAIIPFHDVLCLASVLHNCADRKCGLSNTRVVRQEWEDIAERALAVNHNNPEDVVLNCFKMRDFQHIQRFCPPSRRTDRESMIHEGSVREFNARRAKAQKEATVPSETGDVTNLPSAGPQISAAISSAGTTHESARTANSQRLMEQGLPIQRHIGTRQTIVNEGLNVASAASSRLPRNPLERVRRIG